VNDEGYVQGPPELVVEVAFSSRSIDLHLKKDDYQRSGILEYIVLCVEEREMHWFALKSRRRITPDRRGIYRSRVFPGLWIDRPALLGQNAARLTRTVQRGLSSPEHATFLRRLQAALRRTR
jgi:Uma2 family endonuclease